MICMQEWLVLKRVLYKDLVYKSRCIICFTLSFRKNKYHFWQNIKIQQKVVAVFPSLFHCSKILCVDIHYCREIICTLEAWEYFVIQKHSFLADTWSCIQALLVSRMVTVLCGPWDKRKENEGGMKESSKLLLILKWGKLEHLQFLWLLYFFPLRLFKDCLILPIFFLIFVLALKTFNYWVSNVPSTQEETTLNTQMTHSKQVLCKGLWNPLFSLFFYLLNLYPCIIIWVQCIFEPCQDI